MPHKGGYTMYQVQFEDDDIDQQLDGEKNIIHQSLDLQQSIVLIFIL